MNRTNILLITFVFFLALAGCGTTLSNGGEVINPTVSAILFETPATTTMSSTSTTDRTKLPMTQPTAIFTPSLAETPVVNSLSTVETSTSIDLGKLIYQDINGITSIDLATHEEIILANMTGNEPIRGFWGSSMSPSQRWIANWYNSQGSATLRLLDSEDGSIQDLHMFTDLDKKDADLFWSPDSNYLFVVIEPVRDDPVLGEQTPDPIATRTRYLFSSITGNFQPWGWECDRIALSPQTKKIATWCRSLDAENTEYAVMEWGGEIWFSTEPPDSTLKVRWPDFSLPSWTWSEDGQQITYPDSDPFPAALVKVTVDSGEVLTNTLGFYGDSYAGLSWSSDQSYISFVGICVDTPCLTIIEAETGKVVWTSQGLGEVNKGLSDHTWHFRNNLVLLSTFSLETGNVLFVIDPTSQEVVESFNLDNPPFSLIGWVP